MKSSRGFTLVELMIAVVVASILAAIAIPSYRSHVIKANRSAAQQFMMDVASKEEQVIFDLRRYSAVAASADFPNAPTAGSPGLTMVIPTKADQFYSYVVTTAAGPPPAYTITATPKAGTMQASDGNLTLTSAGGKTPAGKW